MSAVLCAGITVLASSTAMADSREDIEYRIKKVGRLNVVEAAAPAAAMAADGKIDGEALYTAKCSACHASGVLGAPIVGNKDLWSPRIEQGVDTLYTHAMNGFNNMPARGGAADLSDDQVKAVVDFMVSKAK